MVEDWALQLAGSPWALLVLLALTTVDGFFPPVPSESVVIALASLSVSTGAPALWPVVAVAAVGAFLGDQVAYQIGSAVDLRRLRLFRGRRGRRVLDRAEHALTHRGASFIIAARYIPIGRVAVNMTAGSLGFRRRRFVLLTGIAAVTWALYSTAIGIGAGHVLQERPLLGVVVGVVGGLLLGVVVDWVLRRLLGLPPQALVGRGDAVVVAGPRGAAAVGAERDTTAA